MTLIQELVGTFLNPNINSDSSCENDRILIYLLVRQLNLGQNSIILKIADANFLSLFVLSSNQISMNVTVTHVLTVPHVKMVSSSTHVTVLTDTQELIVKQVRTLLLFKLYLLRFVNIECKASFSFNR